MSTKILIVDDEPDIRNLISGILEDEGYEILEAENSRQAYEQIEKSAPALIILDIWLQGSEQDGLEILNNVKAQNPYIPIIMISGHGTIETAVSAIKDGAYDFIEKPFKSDRLLLMIHRALENAQLRRENEQLKKTSELPRELIGNSSTIKKIKDAIERLAPHDGRIIINGARGTGKEVVARLIHELSPRANQKFYILNCFEFAQDCVGESLDEIIAHSQGTIFFEDISLLSPENQEHVAQVIAKIDTQNSFKIIASSRQNIETLVQAGKFDENLYQRLNVNQMHMPELHERREDIPALCEFFIKHLSKTIGVTEPKLSEPALQILQTYNWPGNIKQLENLLEGLILARENLDTIIKPDDLPPAVNSQYNEINHEDGHNIAELPLREAREAFERQYLSLQIKKFNGNISQTAKFIGMERSALHRKLKSLNILGDETDKSQEKKRA